MAYICDGLYEVRDGDLTASRLAIEYRLYCHLESLRQRFRSNPGIQGCHERMCCKATTWLRGRLSLGSPANDLNRRFEEVPK